MCSPPRSRTCCEGHGPAGSGLMVQVLAPVAGLRQEVSNVPDPVFAQGIVGPGAAISPHHGKQCAVAPIDGTLVKVLPHAFLVLSDRGPAVLVHLGIDT